MSAAGLRVDELLSYAVRTDGSVRVHLSLPEADVPPGRVSVRLRAGRRTLDVPGEVTRSGTGAVLAFTVVLDAGRRAWRILLQPAEGDHARVEARLLVAPDQPVALLAGPEPETAMPPPQPRTPASPVRRLARRLPEPVKRPLRRAVRTLGSRPSA